MLLPCRLSFSAPPLLPLRLSTLGHKNFKMGNFQDFESIKWAQASALTRLATIAMVVNKAKFTVGEAEVGGGGDVGCT